MAMHLVLQQVVCQREKCQVVVASKISCSLPCSRVWPVSVKRPGRRGRQCAVHLVLTISLPSPAPVCCPPNPRIPSLLSVHNHEKTLTELDDHLRFRLLAPLCPINTLHCLLIFRIFRLCPGIRHFLHDERYTRVGVRYPRCDPGSKLPADQLCHTSQQAVTKGRTSVLQPSFSLRIEELCF